MKRNFNHIIFGLAVAATVFLPVLLMNAPVAANGIQPIVDGGIYPREPNFFNQGRVQFEKEIQLLLNRNEAAAEPLLKISPDVQRLEEGLAPGENPANLQELPKPSQPNKQMIRR